MHHLDTQPLKDRKERASRTYETDYNSGKIGAVFISEVKY